MSQQHRRVGGGISVAFAVSLCLFLLLPGAVPPSAEGQILQSFTLREFGAFTRDGTWSFYVLPGSPFPFSNLGAVFDVDQVCAPSGGGGVFLSGGEGNGDLINFTPGWPFPPGPLCDPDADDTLWFAYGNSLNLLTPNNPFPFPRYSGRDFPLQPPSCSTSTVQVEGLFLVGRRSADRQLPDLSCQNRDPNNPIRVGNVLICSLANPWLTPTGALNAPFTFSSCEFYATCSDRPIGPNAPRGTCSNTGIGTGSTGSVTVLVNNATNGDPIPGAIVTRSNGGPTQTTDAGGATTFTDVLAGGPVQFTASANGFIPSTATTVPQAGTTTTITISLTPPLSGTDLRIVLNWGADPRDLDSHLTGPSGGSRFHVYFSNRSGGGASLDVDDVSGFGPETITLTQFEAGLYRYSVHHFAGDGTICSTSGLISVNVFFGASQVATFRPPATGCVGGSNNVWVVFEFDPRTVLSTGLIPRNTFYSSGAGGVTGTEVAGDAGLAEDLARLRILPPK